MKDGYAAPRFPQRTRRRHPHLRQRNHARIHHQIIAGCLDFPAFEESEQVAALHFDRTQSVKPSRAASYRVFPMDALVPRHGRVMAQDHSLRVRAFDRFGVFDLDLFGKLVLYIHPAYRNGLSVDYGYGERRLFPHEHPRLGDLALVAHLFERKAVPNPRRAGDNQAHRAQPHDYPLPGEYADEDEGGEHEYPDVVPESVEHGRATFRLARGRRRVYRRLSPRRSVRAGASWT